MPDDLVPISDQATGSFSPTPCWSRLDEGFVTSDGLVVTSADNNSSDTLDMKLSSGTSPGTFDNHTLRYRWRKSAAGGHQLDPTFEIWQGVPGSGTLIVSHVQTNVPETDIVYSTSILPANVANITNYADLYVRIVRTGATGGPPPDRRSLVVDWAGMRVPDAVVVLPFRKSIGTWKQVLVRR